MNRRGLLTGLITTLAAPAFVRAESLMKVAALRESVASPEAVWTVERLDAGAYHVWRTVYTMGIRGREFRVTWDDGASVAA